MCGLVAVGYNDCRQVVVFLNPLVSLSQMVTCLNNEPIAYLVIYWLISISAVLMVGGGSCCGCCNSAKGCTIDRPKRSNKTDEKSSKTTAKKNKTSNETNGGNQQTTQETEEEPPLQQQEQQQEECQQQQQEEEQEEEEECQQQLQAQQQCPQQECNNGGKKPNRQNSKGKKHHKSKNGDNTSQTFDENQSNKSVVCGYDARVQCEQNTDCSQWTCRLSKSHANDSTNRSTNAKRDGESIADLVRAYRLSKMSSVHFDDEGRESENVRKRALDEHRASRSTVANTDCHCRRRTASRRRRKKEDERIRDEEDEELVVTRSSTRDANRRTRSNNSRAHYHEDRCLEYNDSDESDEQP